MIFKFNIIFVCVCGPAVSVDIAPKSQTEPELKASVLALSCKHHQNYHGHQNYHDHFFVGFALVVLMFVYVLVIMFMIVHGSIYLDFASF